MTVRMNDYRGSNTTDTDAVPSRESEDFLYIAEENPVISPFYDGHEKILYDRNHVTIYKKPIEFEDGTKLDIAYSHYHGNQPEGLEGIASYESTAWLTKPEGVYVRRLAHLGRLGIEGTVVGTPKNLGKFSSVSENGRNQLEVMRWTSHHLGRDPHHMISMGMSEGDMISNPVVHIADQFDTTVLYVDGQAGCFPEGVNAETVENTFRNAPGELLLIADFLRIPPRQLWYLRHTLDVSLEGLYAHLQTMPGLLDGTTGKHYKQRPASTFGHKTLSERDMLAQSAQWAPLNAAFPNESMHIHKGTGHVGDCCVNKPSRTAWAGRIETIANVLIDNPHIRTQLGGAALHTALHTLSAEQNPAFLKKPTGSSKLAQAA